MNKKKLIGIIAGCIVVVIAVVTILVTSSSKAQPQFVSASGTTCTVRNNGPTGKVKVTFYQIPDPSSGQAAYKQWVVFSLPEGKEVTLDFSLLNESVSVGKGHYWVDFLLTTRSALHGGSEKASCERVYGRGETQLVKCGSILKEFRSRYCYHSGDVKISMWDAWSWACGFRVKKG